MVDRRMIVAGGLAGLLPLPVGGHPVAAVDGERFPLWPGSPPGGAGLPVRDEWVRRSASGGDDDIAWTHVATPMLTVTRPTTPTGAAVLICPGGGFVRVALGRQPGGIARDFAARGVTAFELLYRLPHDGWPSGADAPLQDAQRAMRVIRAGAGTRWRVDPARIGVVGFSAGGHVAARLASRSGQRIAAPVDAIDAMAGGAAPPAVAGLFYPVVTMRDDGVHAQSRRELLGAAAADPERQRRYSAELDLPADMPPTYVTCNGDDPVVPARNSLLMYEALHAARVPAMLVVNEHGGHGPPLSPRDGTPLPWLEPFLAWSRGHGWPA